LGDPEAPVSIRSPRARVCQQKPSGPGDVAISVDEATGAGAGLLGREADDGVRAFGHGLRAAVPVEVRRGVIGVDGVLRTGNRRFAELWAAGTVTAHREDHKTIEHPAVGPVRVDCDVLTDGDSELKIVIMTAAPGSEDETKLRLAAIVSPAVTTSDS
jgi:hypothetical protein